MRAGVRLFLNLRFTEGETRHLLEYLKSQLYSFTFNSIASRERRLTGDVFRIANFRLWPEAAVAASQMRPFNRETFGQRLSD